MGGSRVENGSIGATVESRSSDWETELDRDARRVVVDDGDRAALLLAELARDHEASPIGGHAATILRRDDDLEARGSGSPYERLAIRLGDDNVASNEQRLGLRFVAALAECRRDEFVAAAGRRFGVSEEDAARLADLASDLGAAALQMEIVRRARQELRAFAGEVDRLQGDSQAREEFLERLARADPATARSWLERVGLADNDAGRLLASVWASRGALDDGCGATGTTQLLQGGSYVELRLGPGDACGAPFAAEPEADGLLTGALAAAQAAIDAADGALDSAGIPTSPVRVFRDYAPVIDRLLAAVLPGPPTIEGTLLEEGVVRAEEEQASAGPVLHVLQVAVRVCVALAAGPLAPVFGLALGAAATVSQGANHDRIAVQRQLGLSGDGASSFSSWGDALRENGVAMGLHVGIGAAAELAGAGHVLAALAGETAALDFETLLRLWQDRE